MRERLVEMVDRRKWTATQADPEWSHVQVHRDAGLRNQVPSRVVCCWASGCCGQGDGRTALDLDISSGPDQRLVQPTGGLALLDHSDAVFLPGVLLPAAVRYAPLLAALRGTLGCLTKHVVLSGEGGPAEDYRVETEIRGLDRFADERGLGRFHLYGRSAGASIGLAYAVERGHSLFSLALDEPASDFSAADRDLLAAAAQGGGSTAG